jgi:ABC-type branched-subunit amino acid transport system substrate-binding protein
MVVGLTVIAGLGLAGCAPAPATTAAPPTAAPPVEAAPTADPLAAVKAALDLPLGEAALQGMVIPLGASLPLSGGDTVVGNNMAKGINLAVEHIKLLGGPQFDITFYDIEMGVVERGLDAIRKMAVAGNPAALVSWCALLDAQQPDAEANQILMFDGGCGIGAPAWGGQPYFWGTRTLNSYDHAKGVAAYMKSEMPEAKRVALLMHDYGSGQEEPGGTVSIWKEAVEGAGLTFAGYVKVPIEATEFSDAITKLKELDPDVIPLTPMDGQAPVTFMKQYVTSGMTAQVIGNAFTFETAELAGSAYDTYWYAGEQFFPQDANSVWGQWFTEEFRKAHGEDPEMFSANYYEDLFTIWDLMRRVAAKGGDPLDGKALQDELMANPVFKSVYGGDPTAVGTYTLDLGNHNVAAKTIYLCTVEDAKIVPFASFLGPSGTDLKIISKP